MTMLAYHAGFWCRRIAKSVVPFMVAAAILSLPASADDPGASVRSKAKPLAAFKLEDHRGSSFTNANLDGKWTLILLGFTQCPDVCPFTLQNIASVLEQMSTRVSPSRMPQVVFVGVDPERDRPVLGDYVHYFNDEFIGATGEWSELKPFVESLEGFVRIDRKSPDDKDYQVHHSAIVSVIDPEGSLVAGLKPPMDPSQTALFLSELMLKHHRMTN